LVGTKWQRLFANNDAGGMLSGGRHPNGDPTANGMAYTGGSGREIHRWYVVSMAWHSVSAQGRYAMPRRQTRQKARYSRSVGTAVVACGMARRTKNGVGRE